MLGAAGNVEDRVGVVGAGRWGNLDRLDRGFVLDGDGVRSSGQRDSARFAGDRDGLAGGGRDGDGFGGRSRKGDGQLVVCASGSCVD